MSGAVCQDALALWRAGATYREIAALTGLSLGAVKYRIELSKTPEASRKSLQKKRACLCCGREFMSAGPHNRLCRACRSKDDYMLFAA